MEPLEMVSVIWGFAFGLFIGLTIGITFATRQILKRIEKAKDETPKTAVPEGTDKEEDQERETQTPQ